MYQIGLELLHNFGALHLGQIEGEGNVIVEGEGKSLSMLNAVAELFGWELLLVGLAIDGEDFDVVPGLGKELEHLIEPIGITGHVRKRRGLDHQGNFAWLVPTQRRSVGIVPTTRLVGCGRGSGGIELRRCPDGRCRCSGSPSRWSATSGSTRGEEGASGGRRRGSNISLDGGPAQYAGPHEGERESLNANLHLSVGVSFALSYPGWVRPKQNDGMMVDQRNNATQATAKK